MEICFILLPILIGAVIALVAIFPPSKILAQLFAGFRLALAFTLGLISFLICFGIYTYAVANASYIFSVSRYECQSCDFTRYYPTEDEERSKDVFILEYRGRNSLLPPFQTNCNTENAEACRIADNITDRVGNDPPWDVFLFSFFYSYIATLTTFVFVINFTLNPPTHKRKTKMIPSPDNGSLVETDQSQTQAPLG
ncbi:MAG: hypothetical protein A2Z14_13200 [Chloroflexi bacterium RBG_16_48_8]|nr:MAG: hypothetical protein A2Z14_13200 [Chloroflexi bacterium RBG_16_48_8]